MNLPEGMPEQTKQSKAASHIHQLLGERKVEAASRCLRLPDGQQWLVLERKG